LSEIIGKDSVKGRQIRDYIEKDPLRSELFRALSDGRWHSTLDLWRTIRRVKKFGQLVGLVRVGKILAQFQNVAGEDVLERREGLDISEWRVSSLFISIVNDIIQSQATPTDEKKEVAKEAERADEEEEELQHEDDEDRDPL
jgi:hypothetical protein